MDDLGSLELLSLISKVTSELQNYLGISDKTLAEFVIAQHGKCPTLAEFKAQMAEMGADFPQSLVESIDRLILTMHPKHKGKRSREDPLIDDTMATLGEVEKRTRIFKGLVVPDSEPAFEDEESESELNGAPASGGLDDTFAMLEGLATNKESANKGVIGRKRSRSPPDFDGDHIRRKKYGRRSRSSSPPRGRYGRRTGKVNGNGEMEDQNEFGRSRNKNQLDYAEHRSRHGGGKKGRKDDEDDHFKRPPPLDIDDAPKMFKVYDGTVTGVKDFGAFVNLKGVRGRVDGLVHVSAMVEGTKVNHPSDFVSRGQPVKVKVMTIQDEGSRLKIGLSMKEVDQATGRDLVPQKRLASGANMEALDGSGVGTNGNDRYGNLTPDVPVIEGDFSGKPMRQKKRMTSPERWEIKQLIASGAISAQDYPDIDEEYNATLNGEGDFEEEVDVDIEVRDEEPPFLAGQTKQSLELSPIRVVKAPDGSMKPSSHGRYFSGEGTT